MIKSPPSDNKKNLSVAEYITAQVKISDKTQATIAKEAGFPHPNMMTMLKSGQSKVPTLRIVSLAEALNVDPVHLYKLCLKQYDPEVYEVLNENVFNKILLSKNEMAILNIIRSADVQDPKITTAQQKADLINFINSLKSGEGKDE